MSRRVLVVFGGVSNENEISVITGTMAANILRKGGDEVVAAYISQQGKIYCGEKLLDIENFKNGGFADCDGAIIAEGGVYIMNRRGKVKRHIKVDVLLNCCHGGACEGGALSGVCALAGLPLASAGMFESAAFMDKYVTKLILKSLRVETLPYVYLSDGDYSYKGELTFPLIVKPVNLGSSIGVERADDGAQLKAALDCAFAYDSGVIIEPYIADKREINCAAYFADGKIFTSECEEAFASDGLLSFEDKYEGGGKSRLPADIPQSLSERVKQITRSVYERLNMRGIVRFDFILQGENVWLSEVNTVPGSLSYYLFSAGFSAFYAVLDKVLKQAESDFIKKSEKRVIRTGILENINSNACKIKGNKI